MAPAQVKRSHERRKGDDDSRKADSQRCGQDGSVVDAGQEAGSQGCMPGRTGVKKWITMATQRDEVASTKGAEEVENTLA